ncbi:hypothetical protein LIER_31055 [Lithospermum erythrorhizon]|uniref:Retrovirus-related Pol polyprotein from transposon TNT 1-94-like beta-barrel domain-containing protein n=1 Tax=Lithospermum erythrorhizon TaxID=34254 RepID=A0AAV3RQD7_LITER
MNNQRSQSKNTLLQDTSLEGGDIMEDNQHWQSLIAGMIQNEMWKAHIGQFDNYQEANLTGQRNFSSSVIIHYSCSIANLNKTDSWIIDSGASTHMCGNLDLFESYKSVNSIHTVNLPDNIVKPVQAIKTIFIHKDIKLCDCLYVPSFRYNLLSVSKLTHALESRLSSHQNVVFCRTLRLIISLELQSSI